MLLGAPLLAAPQYAYVVVDQAEINNGGVVTVWAHRGEETEGASHALLILQCADSQPYCVTPAVGDSGLLENVDLKVYKGQNVRVEFIHDDGKDNVVGFYMLRQTCPSSGCK